MYQSKEQMHVVLIFTNVTLYKSLWLLSFFTNSRSLKSLESKIKHQRLFHDFWTFATRTLSKQTESYLSLKLLQSFQWVHLFQHQLWILRSLVCIKITHIGLYIYHLIWNWWRKPTVNYELRIWKSWHMFQLSCM